MKNPAKSLVIIGLSLITLLVGAITTSANQARKSTNSGYLLNLNSLSRISAINVNTQNMQSFNVHEYWADWRSDEWKILHANHRIIDWQAGRYLFSFAQRTRQDDIINSSQKICIFRYDLYTGKVNSLDLDTSLHPEIASATAIYALNDNDLLLEHYHAEYTTLTLFSMEKKRVLRTYILNHENFPPFLLNNDNRTLRILYYHPEQAYLLFQSELGELYRLDLLTMQTTYIEGISTRFITSHPQGYGGVSQSLVREHLLIGQPIKKREPTDNTIDLPQASAIYHLPTMQIAAYLPKTLPSGDYYLVDNDLILVYDSYFSFGDYLHNIFGGFAVGVSSTIRVRLYRINNDEANLVWQQTKSPIGHPPIRAYFLPELYLP